MMRDKIKQQDSIMIGTRELDSDDISDVLTFDIKQNEVRE